MKSIIFNGFVMIASFTLGICAAYLVSFNTHIWLVKAESIVTGAKSILAPAEPRYLVTEDGTIEVVASTASSSKTGLVEFTVINHSPRPAIYSSYDGTNMLASVKYNGKDQHLGYCGTGLKQYVLESGESISFDIISSVFERFSEPRTGKYQGGFWLLFEGKEGQTYWSNEFE
jgi:hypothetical protein